DVISFFMALLSKVDSTPRAYRLKAGNAAPFRSSTSIGTFPGHLSMTLNIVLMVARTTIIAAMTLAAAGVAQAETLRIGGTGVALGGMRLLGASYMKEHPDSQIEVLPSLGSTGGIKALLAGAVDIAVSSRALTDEERAAGATSNLYARTPLAVVTSPNAPIEDITTGELEAILYRRDDALAGRIDHPPRPAPGFGDRHLAAAQAFARDGPRRRYRL
ncbi:PstS family phosphate ABC transporter substrate-binding protein, partial [Aurantimonas sp. C2-3-R2]|uniref:PstS family phosphate ABC transporter substrate-binding protein n=4 Tax=unclassified Aurantimonas TaxID=2638230 RepID=UPI002E183820|nr:substrate-binding domain-containing protein [Aurantimonas sp. C2-3-R2]